MLNLSLNGNFAGSIESVKLDGYGDGLITDVTMEITSSKFTTTNANRIRNMSDEELAEFLVGFKNTFGEEYEGEASCMEWLQSEKEQPSTLGAWIKPIDNFVNPFEIKAGGING